MRQPWRRVSIACRASRTVAGPVCCWACALGAAVWGLGLCALSLGSAGAGGPRGNGYWARIRPRVTGAWS